MSDAAERPPRMIPDPDGRNADFYRHAATGTLHIQRCDSCSRALHPPRYLCAGCGGDSLTFVPSRGRGRLFSWTITHRPVDPGWAHALPYATVVVEMEEGIRIVGAWRGELADLVLDTPVVAELEPASEEFAFIHFRPAGPEAAAAGNG
jgi:uncharacterized OB-fold protein